MKAVIVGTLSGISAAAIMLLLNQRPTMPVVREIPVFRQEPSASLTARFLASSRPTAEIRALAQILPRVKCDQMHLDKFITWISQSTGANIFVEWNELARGSAAGPDSPVTLDMRNVSASAALQCALDQCQITGERIGFVPVDGIIKVSIHSRLDHWTTIRVYDVRNLIEESVKTTQRRRMNFQRHSATRQADAPIQGNVFGGPSDDDPKVAEYEAADGLRSIILKCINNDAWPNSAEISYFSGRFVISDTMSNHELIAAMLASLRANPQ